MKNLFEQTAVDEVKDRIARLRADSKAYWGKMNAAQAEAHCSGALEWTVGDTGPEPMSLLSVVGRLIKRKVIWGEEPMRRNAPTTRSLVTADDRQFEAERARLLKLVDRFASAGASGCTKNPHPFFGRLSPEEWARLMYKHLDHHLRQFGV